MVNWKKIVDILGKPTDGSKPLDSSTHPPTLTIFNYRCCLYKAFYHDFERRPNYQLFLFFLPGASLPKLDVDNILVDITSFCRKEGGACITCMKDNHKSFFFLEQQTSDFFCHSFLCCHFQIFSMELFLKYIHINAVRRFTVHTWEFVHEPQKKRENTTLTSGSHLFIIELCIWKHCIIDMQGQNHPGRNSTDVNSLTPRKNFLCRMQTVFMKKRETLQYGF